jgi:hypothetical protein
MATVETINHGEPNTATHVQIRIDDGDNTIRWNKTSFPSTEMSIPFTFANAYAMTACLREGLPPEKYEAFLPNWS